MSDRAAAMLRLAFGSVVVADDWSLVAVVARAVRGSSLDWRVECREVWSACPSWEAV